jgi:hypothetical protein
MSDLSRFEQIGKWYENTRGVRALVQLIPNVGGAADMLLIDNLERIRAERAKAFFDELAKGDVLLTSDLIQSEDFLHSYFATVRAAFNTKRREKIRWFAQLLLTGADYDSTLRLDDSYEEFLKILDELSYREICILATLLKHENQIHKSTDETEPQWTMRFWAQFVDEVVNKFRIPQDELDYFLARTSRAATFISYRNFGPVYYDGDLGGKGRLTPIFRKLAQYIHIEAETQNKN